MAWVKLEPRFRQHPKTLAVPILADWLHVCGLCYATEHLTNGFIPAAAVPALDARLRTPNALVETLLSAGLWDRAEGGYLIHDYLVYNLSADEVRDMEAKKAAAGRLGGERSVAARQKRYGTAQPVSEADNEASASGRTKHIPKRLLRQPPSGPTKQNEAPNEASPIRSEGDTDPPPTSPGGRAATRNGPGALSSPAPDGEDHRRCRVCRHTWYGQATCPKAASHASA